MNAFPQENKDYKLDISKQHWKVYWYYYFHQLLRVLRHPTNQKLTASAAHPWQWAGQAQGTPLPVWRVTTTTSSGSKRKEGRIRTCPNKRTFVEHFSMSRTSPDYSSTRTTQSRLNLIANITTSVRPEQVRVLLHSRLASVSGTDNNACFTIIISQNIICN